MKGKEKTYNVYALMSKHGYVYVGKTTMDCERRFKGGNGFLNCDAIKYYILNDGWSSFRTITVAQNLPKDKAVRIELAAASAVQSQLCISTQNTTAYYAGREEMDALAAVGYPEWLGDSFNGFGWGVAAKMNGWTVSETKSVICETPIVKPNNEAMKKKQKQTKKITPMRVQTVAGVKLELGLDSRRLKNDGQYPVTIRLYQNKQYRHLQTGYACSPSEYPRFAADVEAHLNKMFDGVCAELTRQAVNQGSADILSVGIKTTSTETLCDIMREKASMMDKPATVNNYLSSVKLVERVFPDGLKCERVSPSTIGRILEYMKGEGYTNATMNIYLSNIKASINYAIYKGYIRANQYPFKKNAYEADKITLPKSDKRDDKYLTAEQMERVWEYFKETKNIYVGMFLFSYLHGGLNIADILPLTFDDYFFKEGAFRYQRLKTERKNDFKVVVPRTKWTDELFDTLGIVPKKGEVVFKKFANRGKDFYSRKANVLTYVNKTLIRMGEMLNFEEKVSMQYARHSFATIANKQSMPYTMLEAAMGHSNGGVSSHYIGGFSVDEMRPYFERLLA
jgi:integrase